jgi:hypothetical protein
VGPKACSDISVTNYQSTQRNTPEDRRSHLHRGGSLSLTTITSSLLDWYYIAEGYHSMRDTNRLYIPLYKVHEFLSSKG